MSQAHASEDPRKRRTRQDLMAAFFSLVLSRRYHEIRVSDVLARASVSRSTFYEHFRNKDDLLAASLEGPFQILAALTQPNADIARVQGILQHFWDNRALARSLFQGAALRVVRRTLVEHMEAALTREQRSRLRIPARLAAHALADGVFSPITGWLMGEAKCSAEALAQALSLATAACTRALQHAHPLTDLPAGDAS